MLFSFLKQAASASAIASAVFTLTSLPGAQAAEEKVYDIVRPATEIPAPIGKREPRTVKLDLETIEVVGQLDEGATYTYWTFAQAGGVPGVPGPFLRVRAGDTVEVSLKNADGSAYPHNIDFHAVTGPGGGGKATMVMPGETKGFTFKALNPGLYIYHCATPMHAQHIASGMYGLILVEPEEGLPPAKEFFVVQGEIYTEQAVGTKGHLDSSYDKLMSEDPEYYVFNGAAGALTGPKALKAEVGDLVRVYVGVGGPNKTSSFHVIGEIFDRAWPLGGITAAPETNVQTITVPPGGAAMVEFKVEVPGSYLLVDHALSRLERGLVGVLQVEGPENPEIFRPGAPVMF